jgi:hypothetical protein
MRNKPSCLALAVCLALGTGAARGQAPDKPLEKTPVSPAPVVAPVRTGLPVPAAPGLSFSKGLPEAGEGPRPYPDNPPLPPLPPPPPPPPAPFPAPEPQMIGDFFSPFALVPVSQRVQVNVAVGGAPGPGLVAAAQLNAAVPVPVLGPAAFKIADNESPRPLDRVFFTFAYVHNPAESAFTPGAPTASALPAGLALSGFSPLTPGPPLEIGSALNGVAFLQALANSVVLQPEYSRYLEAALRQGNLTLPGAPADLKNAAAVLANAQAAKGNFLAPKNLALLAGNSTDAQIQAITRGVFLLTGATSLPLTGLQIYDRPFDRSTATALRVDATETYLGTFGFEKTFLNGDASVGLRAPIIGWQGDGSLRESDFGDLSLVLKYALLNGGPGGDVVSTGLVVTAPTGPSIRLAEGGSALHPTLFQPYLAGLWTRGRFYAQGFTSLAVPTDFREPAVWFNDVGAGYTVYSDPASGFLTALTPTLELHLNTPLGHEGLGGGAVTVPDSLSLTGGMHFTFFNRVRFTAGAGTPMTGPHPFDFAAFAQFNVLF